jgi:PAS domain S-box-containing protein
MDAECEVRRLRRALRDLVALSTIPAAWVGREPESIVAGLADVLVGSLQVDFAFVRFCDPDGGAKIEAARGEGWPAFPQWLQRRLAAGGLFARPEIVAVHAGHDGFLRGVILPIGVNGEWGFVAAACDRPGFPDETDQILLSVAANHTATAVRSARLVEAHRRAEDALALARSDLERRVAERTAELLRTATEALAAQRRFRDLVNSVDGIVWEADAETFVFSFVSEQAERILGYSAERWLREPTFWKDHLHPDDRDRAVRHCADCTTQKGDHDFEYRMIAADGGVVWLRDLVTVVVEGGRPARLRGVMVDITERKRTEEERQAGRWVVESLDRVNLAIQGTPDLERMLSDVLDATLSTFDGDRAWLVTPCDPGAPSVTLTMQRTRPEFPGLFAVGDAVPLHPDNAAAHRTVRAAPGPVTFGPGSQHPLSPELAKHLGTQSRMIMALYPKGEPPYMFGLSQCSSPRVWTRQEQFLFQEIGRRLSDALTSLSIFHRLRESEQRYRHIFESTGVSIWEEDFSRVKAVLDELKAAGVDDVRAYMAAHPEFVQKAVARVRIVDVNTAAVKMFAAETKGALLASLDRVFVPETLEVFVEELVAIAEGRGFFEAETVLQTLKGDRLTALLTITFPRPSARFDSVLVTLMDITGRKRAEFLTRQVFESSPDRVNIIGMDYRFRRVNPVFERFWGLAPSTGAGMHVADIVGIADFEARVKPALDRCLLGEDVSWAGWMGTPRGRQYSAITYTPLRPNTERVEAILVIARDLTEHMVAVEALQRAQAELTHVTRVTTLGELAASIAHEVNQPLAAIVADGTASLNWLAAKRPDLDRVREALDTMIADGHRAAEVIQRIRQLATKSAPQKTPLDLNELIRGVIPLVRAELLRHDVSLGLELASAAPSVVGDRVQLQQVILNLVMNAIDAMAPVVDRPRELVIRSVQPAHDHVTIAVQDTGVGIAANQLDELFNAFFTTKPGGMGMGLSISRSIIEAHGGRVWATPNEPHGASFHFSLPVAPSAV